DGADVRAGHTAPPAGVPDAQDMTGRPHIGVWVDRTDFLHQELTADGRYDETLGGRPHAFRGRYWVDGDRVDYLDDLGFWAFGEFNGDELHHAGYVMGLR
ncbi:MAG: Atu4866 domain-containing protein, partial [Pseudonocardia sp.]|nr:Atu4866 domain-containing protein [Pseudonocardia sp.]